MAGRNITRVFPLYSPAPVVAEIPRYVLINAAMMPTVGRVYAPVEVKAHQFAKFVQDGAQLGRLISYIGYPETADFLTKLTGVEIPVNRKPASVERGDLMLICKLDYRVPDPNTKGQAVNQNNFIFWICDVS